MTRIDRRTLLVGATGLVLTACGGGSGPDTKATSGPNIVKPNAGTVVTAEDTAALREKLGAAFRSGDVEQLLALIDPESFAIEDVRKRWTRRFENFDRLGFVTGEWYVGTPTGRTRNGAGGEVEYRGDLVFAHQVEGCDAQQVVESYSAEFRKQSEDAPLELMHLGDAEAAFDPSIWDVADVDAIETEHAWIVFRGKDAARAKRFAPRIEDGAKRAFDLMPRPKGVEKVFYSLTWNDVDGKLYGGVAVGDADAHAYYHPFLDPEELATGQKATTDVSGLPRATGRVGMHESAFDRPDFTDVACHEAVHVLANQWYSGSTAAWVTEGLAVWGERGGPANMARDGARIRSAFGEFERTAVIGREGFYDSPRRSDFYACAGAVYAYLEDSGGRKAVFGTAEKYYAGDESVNEAEGAVDDDTAKLLAATRSWLNA
ncbi:hypothetical protein ACHAAC_04880 [Aeromicrobium sp. CF4.19]|uniref:hypothetical protein n=1 Tax=Aeromicrobium sp. CF4.19 TaxID=3373082 RepID=UPI003EE689F0